MSTTVKMETIAPFIAVTSYKIGFLFSLRPVRQTGPGSKLMASKLVADEAENCE